MKIIKSNKSDKEKARIVAAEDDFEFFEDEPGPAFDDDFDIDEPAPEGFDDEIDVESEGDEELEEELVEEDDPSIEVDNNISNHYIAECDICKGVFITNLVESDMEVEMLSGTCPICGKDAAMYLKWLVKDIDA